MRLREIRRNTLIFIRLQRASRRQRIQIHIEQFFDARAPVHRYNVAKQVSAVDASTPVGWRSPIQWPSPVEYFAAARTTWPLLGSNPTAARDIERPHTTRFG